MKETAIHWFRRDLRIADNPSLRAAIAGGNEVTTVYFVSEWKGLHHWTGPNRQEFLCGTLRELDADLAAIGGRLVIRQGDPVAGLEKLARETNAVAIHCNASPDPFGKSVETRLRARCRQLGIAFHLHHEVTLHTPGEVLTKTGSPFKVFTPYYNAWLPLEKPAPFRAPERIKSTKGVASGNLPTLSRWGLHDTGAALLRPGESAAKTRLREALSRIPRYRETRDSPALSDGTSRLSQDLRHGTLSIRTVHAEAARLHDSAPPRERESIATFIKELAWREFYFAILHHFPSVLNEEFNPSWRGLPWDEPGETFGKWQAGLTGFPIVDAGMRELLATGHMHNRLRMITAMFLTKDLHVDWKAGESHFMRHLVDGEIASNNGGWQWSAGTGADAAPYFRIQNPWLQSARHDPAGEYIRRWIPELRNTPAKALHAPPPGKQSIAPDYPPPCVDHTRERDRTLAIFKKHALSSGRR